MRLLVTGAGGFIGRHVTAQALARGLAVRAMVRSTPSPIAGVELVRHDLREPAGLASVLAEVDAVVHCAGSLHSSAAEQERDTVAGTRHLVAAMGEAGVSRLILLSSFAVYDHTALTTGSTLTESSPVDRNSIARGPYPAAKLAQEEIVGLAPQLRWTILRPGLVFGPDRLWFQHLGMRITPRLWVTLSGSGQLPLAFVGNCADAALDALASTRAEGRTVNIVDDDLPARAAYVAALAARTSPRPRVADVPWTILKAASSTSWGLAHGLLRDALQPPGILHTHRLDARCKPLLYSNALARDVLGWRPGLAWREALERSAHE